MQAASDQESSFIRVSFKSTSSDGKKDGPQGPESESTTSSDSQDVQTEEDWEQAPTRKPIVATPK